MSLMSRCGEGRFEKERNKKERKKKKFLFAESNLV
jgi:hypothetical protein